MTADEGNPPPPGSPSPAASAGGPPGANPSAAAGGASEAPSSPPAGAPASPAPGTAARPSLDAIRDMQRRRQRRWRIVTAFSVLFAASVLGTAIAHWILTEHFRSLYHDQPWIRIAQTYRDIDHGAILVVHREKAYKDLEERYQDQEAYVIGFVSRISPREESGGGAPAPGPATVEVQMDVPHFEEEVNLFDDEVRVQVPLSELEGIGARELVIARGKAKDYSRYRLRIEGASIRPLGRLEKWYVQQFLPPTRATREAYGFNRLRDKKK